MDSATRSHWHGQEPPNFAQSMKNFILSGYINILLIAVPLSFASHFAGWGSTADFIISFIAIVPLASLLGDATEQCALKVGQTVGGLLNATFGNAVSVGPELWSRDLMLTGLALRLRRSSSLSVSSRSTDANAVRLADIVFVQVSSPSLAVNSASSRRRSSVRSSRTCSSFSAAPSSSAALASRSRRSR